MRSLGIKKVEISQTQGDFHVHKVLVLYYCTVEEKIKEEGKRKGAMRGKGGY